MAYVAPFRETSLLDGGRHHGGSKKILPHRNLSESYATAPAAGDGAATADGGFGSGYDGGGGGAAAGVAGAGEAAGPAGAHSRGQGRAHSKRHLAPVVGSARVADALAHAAHAEADAAARAAAATGRNGNGFGGPPSLPALAAERSPRATRAVGGADSVVLGQEGGGRFSSTHGIKEDALRVAADPAAQRAVREFPVAGMRPEQRAPRSTRAVGGDDHTSSVFDDGSALSARLPREGMDEAQRRSALEPAARQLAEASSPAGTRILRAPGLRVTTQAVGGPETGHYDWPTSGLQQTSGGAVALAAAPGPQSGAASTFAVPVPVISSQQRGVLHPEQQSVGGRSAPFLQSAAESLARSRAEVPAAVAARSSMGAILQQQPADALSARPGSSSGRGGVAGSARNSSDGIANMFSALAGLPPPPGERAAAGPPARSPVRRAQPVGGVGNLLGAVPGAGGLAAPPPSKSGVRLIGSNASNVTFG